jgi:hypothetical protein
MVKKKREAQGFPFGIIAINQLFRGHQFAVYISASAILDSHLI